MKRFFKATLITLGAIIILVGAAAATLPLWLPVEKIKNFIISEVKTRTGREVTAGGLAINLFKGLELSDVVIKESSKYPAQNFVVDKKMYIKYSLPALLNKILLITEIRFESPVVIVSKGKDGLLNYADIMDTIKAQAQQAEEKALKTAKTGEKKAFFKSVVITGLSIKDGTFTYADYSREKPLVVNLNNLNFQTENLALTVVKPINVQLSFDVVYGKYNIPADAKAKATLDLKNKNLDMIFTKMSLAGMPCTGTMSLKNFRDVYGEIFTDIGFNDLLKFTPAAFNQRLKDNNVTGELSAKNKFTFKYENGAYTQRSETKINKGVIMYKDKKAAENITGNIYLSPDFTVKGDLKGLLAGSAVQSNFTTSDTRTLTTGRIDIAIDSPKFAVEYLLALFPKKDKAVQPEATAVPVAAKGKKAKAPAVKKEAQTAADMYIKLNAASLAFKTVETGKVFSDIKFKNSKLYADTLIEAYQGKMYSNIFADMNKSIYSATISCDKMEINKLMDDVIAVMPRKDDGKKNILDDMKGKVFGRLNAKTKFSGDTFKDIAHTIKGDGNFEVLNGNLKDLQISKDLYEKTKAEVFKQDVTFDIMSASFTMKDGRLDTKNFKIESGKDGLDGDARIRAKGWMSVDKALDFRVEMDLHPQVGKQVEEAFSKNLGIGDLSFAYNDDGWMPFDFKVFNTIEDKKYDYWQPRMFENIKKNFGKKIGEEGGKFFNTLKDYFK